MDVFSHFTSTPYIFLELNRGGILGDTIKSQTLADGIFKERDGRVEFNQSLTTEDSSATLHVKPSEPFVASLSENLVGHGIRHQGQDYLIIGQTTGRGGVDFGTVEHYHLTLRREELGVEDGS